MRYHVIGSKFLYYCAFASQLAGLLVLSFIYYRIFPSQEKQSIIFLSAFWLIGACFFSFFVRKFIHCKIDLERRFLLFGNIIFNQEKSLKVIKYKGHFLFYRTIWRIDIEGRTFLCMTGVGETEDVLQSNTRL